MIIIIYHIYSQSNSLELPIGTILPYVGDLADIPKGWYLCDGSNGTPDMRDLFIVGAGKNYELYNTGGKNEVELNADQLPAHYHNLYTSGQLAANRNGSVWGIELEGWTLVEEILVHDVAELDIVETPLEKLCLMKIGLHILQSITLCE